MGSAGLPASDLPIESVLGELLESLARAPNVVLVAPPGAGKTTRVPLALLDAEWRGDGRVIVLEPRRLAARAAARFMARSLGEDVGGTVGYRVRMDARVSKKTRIEVVTEGVFTRMILADPGLDGIAAVLFDEFHERSLDGDTGLAFALEAQDALRPDLRLVVMSATLDDARIAATLKNAPVVSSQGRSHPVETRYLNRDAGTRIEDAAVGAVRKALAEEAGSILVFLPGQGEIRRTAERLADICPSDTDICPLYGALKPAEQDRAIQPPPAGRRKVVLATAIAETSLTIEGVRVVIDSGLARKPRYEPANGLTRLETRRVSKAAADQRRGRAGRLGPGVCYRLWNEGQTGALDPFDRPEILDADLTNLVLDLAAWGTSDPAGPTWLDPPPKPAWSQAVALLRKLGALSPNGLLTDEGRALAKLPLHPRLAHMVYRAAQHGAAQFAGEIAVVVSEHGLGGNDADLTQRLRRLRQDGGRAGDARKLAARWARRAEKASDIEIRSSELHRSIGSYLALAYPDRIAQARGAPGSYRLANGRGASLDAADPLAREPFLAVAELQGAAQNARITLAAPIALPEIDDIFADRIETSVDIEFDTGAKAVRARRRRRLGHLVVEQSPEPNPATEAVTACLLNGIAKLGLSVLPWSKKTEQLRKRISFLHAKTPQVWPNAHSESLISGLPDWLGPFIAGKASLAAITAPDLHAAIDALVPYHSKQELNRLAPVSLTLPTGREVPIDYGAEAGPTVSVKPQELFGLDRHPMLAGTEPLMIELLSPAGRPIQLTRDLPGFWRGSWADVRRDLRGRYPKHDWPEDPAAANPGKGPKRRK